MWFVALASDYDGTLAHDGVVKEKTIEALKTFGKSGRKLLLVTGREIKDLREVLPDLSIFDIIVAENGAVLYVPSTKEETAIAPEPPPEFIRAIEEANISPLSIGKVVVATFHPNETILLEIIRKLGLEHQVIFNKGSVMVLPPGVNKATGLDAALAKLNLSRHNVIGVGDAQNDLAFLTASECGVAVANSLDSVKEAADIVTKGDHGAGVEELIERVLANDLSNLAIERHGVLLGKSSDDRDVFLDPRGPGLLIAGTSGSGKSTAVTAIIENLAEKNYQYALIDPEGDFEVLPGASSLGNTQHAPTVDEAVSSFSEPKNNTIINLLGVPLSDRPAFLGAFMPKVQAMRNQLGRPHWVIIDEAHHMICKDDNHIMRAAGTEMSGVILITVHPEEVAVEALQSIDQAIILGQQPKDMLDKFAASIGDQTRFDVGAPLADGEAFYWKKGGALIRLKIATPHSERRRHLKKYAEGDVGPEKSFFFKGPQNKLNLKVQNLILFVQIAEGIDDETWMYHLARAEYSKWFATAIKDEELATRTAAIEEDKTLKAAESKKAITDLIREKYTASATGTQLNSDNSFA
jgi:hydroxymethylpyrimidine pyrophosphatase-like HAD family hydrolase